MLPPFLLQLKHIILFSVLCVTIVDMKPKYVFVSNVTCDRYSLDALYHEKYETLTEDILADSTVFIRKLVDNIENSLQELALQNTERQKSDEQDRFQHAALTTLKYTFDKNAKKILKNVTSQWNNFISKNHGFLAAKKDVSFEDVIKGVENLDSAYKAGKHKLDKSMELVISFIKSIISNGMLSLDEIMKMKERKTSGASKTRNEKQEENKTEEVKQEENKTEEGKQEEKTVEEKKKEIAKDILPPFLLNITERIIDRKIDLEIPVNETSEDRDSVLDDICFATTMMKAKVRSIDYSDEYVSEEYLDLTRRNLYILWANTASSVYQDKIAIGTTGKKINSTKKFEEFWSNNEELVNTLVSLLQLYP